MILTDPRRPLFRYLTAWLLVLGMSSGCGALRRSDPPPDITQDPRIRSEVEARLAAEPSIGPGRIRVEVNGRTVILYGQVLGVHAWQCAIATAELVQGVSTVVDYLVIERGPTDVRCLAARPAVRADTVRGGG